MIAFNSWDLITEATSAKPVITHLTHLEDLILTKFQGGANEAVDFIQGIANVLGSHSKESVNFSVKIDGSPSLIAGIDPGDKQFFIGTKGVFAKTPKLAKSHKDVDTLYQSPGLNALMHTAFDELKKLSWSGIMQGDVLFTTTDKKSQNINGAKYITFKPNTILYAIPANSSLGSKVAQAKFGICFHTTYTGKSLDAISAKSGANIEALKPPSSVLLLSNRYRDLSGTVTLTAKQAAYLESAVSQLRATNRSLGSNKFIQLIQKVPQIQAYLMQFQNSLVRQGQSITLTPKTFAIGFVQYLETMKAKEIAARKSPKGQDDVAQQFTTIINYVKQNANDLVKIIEWQNLVLRAKAFLLKKLNVASALETFYETDNGIVAGSHEGFVATDSHDNFVKLVDRNVFSRANFQQNNT